MNRQSIFLSFLHSLETPENASLLEAVSQGFKVTRCLCSYDETSQPHTSLYENPDTVKIPGENISIHFQDTDARPFIYLIADKKLFIDISGDTETPGKSHGRMIRDLIRKEIRRRKIPIDKNNRDAVESAVGHDLGFYNSLKINGRIWLDSRIITFWQYPTEDQFHEILKQLSSARVPIDSSWVVEVYKRNTSLSNSTTLVPISEYHGEYAKEDESKPDSAETDMLRKELADMQEQHTVSPEKKIKDSKKMYVKDAGEGYGSLAEKNALKNAYRGESKS